ncbi:adult-specific rigid cuticular protein 15.7-like [Stegodyphus dumicola]|uniref:adult-specific rigid cuticular protein 15.7-like n=1 Tax=Stegodyphus dumicola TaxID=202533 RepID=UPI0015A78C69|nr:adult-specific rigid cuticular protein 15.7-like [Stegodyphus dumicola]
MCYKVSLILTVVALYAVEAFVPVIEEIHMPQPYSFGYSVKDKHGEQHRKETGDGVGVVKGSYGFTDERGIHRQVNYIADKAGYRAEVKTNEHGTAPLDPAAVKMISSAHPYLGGAGAHLTPKAVVAPIEIAAAVPKIVNAGVAAHLSPVGMVAMMPKAAAPGIVTYGTTLGGKAGYAAPVYEGVVKGYDSRFGAY